MTGIAWPFAPDVVVTHKSTGRYESSRDGGARIHRGKDLHVPNGTPVYAMTDGVIHSYMPGYDGVITFGDGHGYGLQINTPTVRFTYAHLGPQAQNSQHLAFAPGIEPGVTVKQGQLLGWSGESGATLSGPHLHVDWRDLTGTVRDDIDVSYTVPLGHVDGPRIDPWPTLELLEPKF